MIFKHCFVRIIQIYQGSMSNLVQIQRHRMRLYGEMLKSDLTERRNQQKLQKQTALKRDSLDLERHIENTRKMDQTRKQQLREMNHALKEDNMMLSTLKKIIPLEKPYAEQGQDFINQIHDMDGRRLGQLKYDLVQQYHDNKDFTTSKRQIQDKIKEIQKLQTERHTKRVNEMQMESVKNYEQIKRKHQQDMSLFERHRKLVQENQNYRDQIEAFTNVNRGGIFERFNRNQYLQRRTSLRQNQDEIMKQMQQFQRRKHQDSFEYKRKVGDLEESMLGSILSKPPRYEPRAYSHELRNQMQEDSLKKMEENNAKREKIELNNIYGGVHGNERQKMMKIIDRGLGIDRLSRESFVRAQPSRAESTNQLNSALQNPELKLSESQRYPTPKQNKRKNLDYSQQFTAPNVENNELPHQNYVPSEGSNASSQRRRYFKSYDLITGKNKFYGAE